MKRQGLIVTPMELLSIFNKLVKEGIDLNQKCQINIVNKQKLSDTWKIEWRKNGSRKNT